MSRSNPELRSALLLLKTTVAEIDRTGYYTSESLKLLAVMLRKIISKAIVFMVVPSPKSMLDDIGKYADYPLDMLFDKIYNLFSDDTNECDPKLGVVLLLSSQPRLQDAIRYVERIEGAIAAGLEHVIWRP